MDGFGGMGGDSGDADEGTTRARGGGDGGIKVGLDNSWSLGFQASLPLIAPQIWKSVAVSDTQILRSLEASRQSRQNLVDQVKSAYYGLLLAQDSRIVIQESYDMARLTHETYVKQAAAGAASDYDVLRTSVAMKNIEPEIIQADIAIRQARLQLLVLMGVDSAFEFEAATKLADYEKTMYDEVFALEADYSNNADLRLLDIDTKLLQQQVAMKKLAFVPTRSQRQLQLDLDEQRFASLGIPVVALLHGRTHTLCASLPRRLAMEQSQSCDHTG